MSSNVPGVTSVTDVTDLPGGARLLNRIEQYLSKYVIYPGHHERVAHVLWIAHCWFMDAWESTPRIAFLSPEPGSGKSRALEVTEPLVPRPVHAVNATPAYLFRKVSDPDGAPTILFDEIDTVFGPKAKENEELRGLLNAGHRKGAMAGRCVIKGKEVTTEELPAYSAVALAGLDDLPDTIMTRSVVVRMRRRAPGETVQPWRLRTCGPEADHLGIQLMEWSQANQHLVGTNWPQMPEGVEDRNADVWEALIVVADLAGGRWPERSRAAAVAMVKKSQERPPSIGVLLLRDIRTVFTEQEAERLSTDDLITGLVALDESPWADLRGKELDSRALSFRLKKYDIAPRLLRVNGQPVRGYDRSDFKDPWSRYLPQDEAEVPRPLGDSYVTSVTPLQNDVERNTVTDVTDKSRHAGGKQFGTCTVCKTKMQIVEPGQQTHPGCDDS